MPVFLPKSWRKIHFLTADKKYIQVSKYLEFCLNRTPFVSTKITKKSYALRKIVKTLCSFLFKTTKISLLTSKMPDFLHKSWEKIHFLAANKNM